jgi:hypothetical protein
MKSAKRTHRKDLSPLNPSIEKMSPEERIAKSYGLKLWEYNLWRIMEHLESAMKRQDDYAWVWNAYGKQFVSQEELDALWLAKQREHAAELARFIEGELLRRNYQVLRIAAEGWENLHSGKPFKSKSGKPINQNCVHKAWIALVLRETHPPSLDEILIELACQNPPVKMTKARLSTVMNELELKGRYRDNRNAENRPKKAK